MRCTKCSKVFKSRSRMRSHSKLCLSFVAERTQRLQCEICRLEFGNGKELSLHVLVTHENLAVSRCDNCDCLLTEPNHKCDKASKSKAPKSNLKGQNSTSLSSSRMKKRVTFKDEEISPEVKPVSSTSGSTNDEAFIQCSKCFTLLKKATLPDHMLKVHKDSSFLPPKKENVLESVHKTTENKAPEAPPKLTNRCEHCDRSFSTQKGLKCHRWRCKQATMRTTKQQRLDSGSSMTSRVKMDTKKQCTICSNTFLPNCIKRHEIACKRKQALSRKTTTEDSEIEHTDSDVIPETRTTRQNLKLVPKSRVRFLSLSKVLQSKRRRARSRSKSKPRKPDINLAAFTNDFDQIVNSNKRMTRRSAQFLPQNRMRFLSLSKVAILQKKKRGGRAKKKLTKQVLDHGIAVNQFYKTETIPEKPEVVQTNVTSAETSFISCGSSNHSLTLLLDDTEDSIVEQDNPDSDTVTLVTGIVSDLVKNVVSYKKSEDVLDNDIGKVDASPMDKYLRDEILMEAEVCSKCKTTFQSEFDLLLHKCEPPRDCDIATSGSENRRNFRPRKKSKESKENQAPRDSCAITGKRRSLRAKLRLSYVESDNDEPEVTVPPLKKRKLKESSKNEFHECEKCLKVFDSLEDLFQHQDEDDHVSLM